MCNSAATTCPRICKYLHTSYTSVMLFTWIIPKPVHSRRVINIQKTKRRKSSVSPLASPISFAPFYFNLMFGLNINWSSWTVHAWFCAVLGRYMIGWLDAWLTAGVEVFIIKLKMSIHSLEHNLFFREKFILNKSSSARRFMRASKMKRELNTANKKIPADSEKNGLLQ